MADETAGKNPDNRKKKKTALMIFGAVVVIGLIVIFFYIGYSKTHISTDDAFVEGTVHTISPKVSGNIIKIYVNDNQAVKEGELLAEIDPASYTQMSKEAEASKETEERRTAEINAGINAQEKRVAAAEATLKRAQAQREELAAAVKTRKADLASKKSLLDLADIELKRNEELFKKEFIPANRYDRAKTERDTAMYAENAAEESLRQAEAALKTQDSVIAEAKALLGSSRSILDQSRAALKTQKGLIKTRSAQSELASLNLSYTKVYSPAEGYVTRKSVEEGNFVQAGTPVMAVVELKGVYIVANYKETEIHGIKAGQEAEIKIDTYPGKKFKGHVDSIMAGTGSAFSLFPPENATGNFVKVVQRVPVKIIIDEGVDKEHPLRVGMSAEPTILVK